MACPVYQSFKENKTVGGTTCVVDKPTSTAEGDLLIGFLSTDGVETHTSPESGSWNIILENESEGSGKQTFSVWYKIAGASEPSTYTFTTGSSEDMYAWIIRITGHSATSPIHKIRVNEGDSGDAAIQVVTTDHDDCLIISAFGADDDDITVDNGWSAGTNITVDKSGTGANSCSGGCPWINQLTAGQSTQCYCSLTAVEEWIGIVIAIRSASSGWVTPLGFVDSGDEWSGEEKAYDGSTGSQTTNVTPATSWTDYLELTVPEITNCTKMRFYNSTKGGLITSISIDLYYNAQWNNIYEGAFANDTWIEKEIGSTQAVTAMRIKLYNNDTDDELVFLREAHFWDAGASGLFYKSLAGVFTATGAIIKLPKISLAGVLSSTGSVVKKTLLSLAGNFGLTGIVSSIFKFPKSLAGVFGLTGTIVKLPKISLSGVFSSTGTIGRNIKIGLAGVFGATGVVSSVWKSFQFLAGTFGLTGVITKLPKISLSGAFDLTGSIVRKILLSLSGVFDFSGSVSGIKKVFKSLSGAFDFSGNLASELLGGIFYKSLSGAFGFSGSLARKTLISLVGVFGLTGTISSILTKFKSLVGTFSLTGTLVKLPKIILSGAFNLTGIIGRLIKKSLSGVLTSTGDLASQLLGFFYKSLEGTMTFTGGLGRLIKISLSGVFSLTGVVSTVKKVFKALAGVFGLTGILTSAFGYTKSLAGSFNLTGTINVLIKKTLSGYISLSGRFKFRTVWYAVVKTVDTWTKVIKDGVFRRLG